MIEYLYNTIRATAGDDMQVTAVITDDHGNDITSDCKFAIFSVDDQLLVSTVGEYTSDVWHFTIPTDELKKGKYWYCIYHHDERLSFMQRLYLV